MHATVICCTLSLPYIKVFFNMTTAKKTYMTSGPKKQKSKKSLNIWGNIKFFFASLFKNDYCVEGRNKPWYAAVLIVLCATILALTPIMTANFQAKGSDLLASPTYSLETSLTAFGQDMLDKGVELRIENNQLSDPNNTWNDAYGSYGEEAVYVHSYTREEVELPVDSTSSDSSIIESVGDTPIITEVEVVDFAAYYSSSASMTLENFARIHLENPDPGDDPDDEDAVFSINALFMNRDGFVIYKMPNGTESNNGARFFRWDDPSFQGKTLAELVTTNEEGIAIKGDINNADVINESFTAWKSFLDRGYNSLKISSSWSTTGIIFAVYAILDFVLGLVVYFVTRGKNNPFRIYTFWECQKIAYWASLTPGIISLIFGFLIPGMALMLYILTFGMRVMWMSFRSLKPYNPK